MMNDEFELAADGAKVERAGDVPTDVEPATVPLEATRCPGCGEKPTTDSIARHRLSDSGYIHDDVYLKCPSDTCGRKWTLGIPIGDPEEKFYEDLVCGCGEFGLVHRVAVVSPENIKLHLKCPHCFAFWQTQRIPDGSGVALVGTPHITGRTDDATPWGYRDDGSGGTDTAAADDAPDETESVTVDPLPMDDPKHGVAKAEAAVYPADISARVSTVPKTEDGDGGGWINLEDLIDDGEQAGEE